MIANYLSAIKACFVLYNMSYSLLDHPRIKYFQKAMRINRPLVVTFHNVIDLYMLERISKAFYQLKFPQVFRAIFLTGFGVFFRLSNLAPHTILTFDPSRHLTGHDIFFMRKLVKVLIKWSKPCRIEMPCKSYHCPRFPAICPYISLKALSKLYPMTENAFCISSENN